VNYLMINKFEMMVILSLLNNIHLFGQQDSINHYLEENLVTVDSTYILTDLIGKIFINKYPPNHIDFCGGSFGGIGSGYSIQKDCDIPYRATGDSTLINLFLTQSIKVKEDKNIYLKILNIFTLPPLLRNEVIVNASHAMVHKHNLPIFDIVGVGITDNNGFINRFRLAWRPNLETGEFVPIIIDSITCQLEGY